MMAGPKIQIQGVAKSFDVSGRSMPALAEVDLDVAERSSCACWGRRAAGNRRC